MKPAINFCNLFRCLNYLFMFILFPYSLSETRVIQEEDCDNTYYFHVPAEPTPSYAHKVFSTYTKHHFNAAQRFVSVSMGTHIFSAQRHDVIGYYTVCMRSCNCSAVVDSHKYFSVYVWFTSLYVSVVLCTVHSIMVSEKNYSLTSALVRTANIPNKKGTHTTLENTHSRSNSSKQTAWGDRYNFVFVEFRVRQMSNGSERMRSTTNVTDAECDLRLKCF